MSILKPAHRTKKLSTFNQRPAVAFFGWHPATSSVCSIFGYRFHHLLALAWLRFSGTRFNCLSPGLASNVQLRPRWWIAMSRGQTIENCSMWPLFSIYRAGLQEPMQMPAHCPRHYSQKLTELCFRVFSGLQFVQYLSIKLRPFTCPGTHNFSSWKISKRDSLTSYPCLGHLFIP